MPGDLADLVVEAHVPVAVEHHVDLLGVLMAVAEGLALPRPQPVVGEADRLAAELLAGEVCLAQLAEAELRCAVLGLIEVLDRVAHRDEPTTRLRAARMIDP